MRVKAGPGTTVGKILRLKITARGYCEIMLSKNGDGESFMVHRLVMAAFVGQCPEGYQVNHIDGGKTNNRLENLEYVTPVENIEHARRSGLMLQRGEDSSRSKLTEENVHEIRRRFGKETQTEIAAHFNVCQQTINHIATGRTWSHIKEPTDDLTTAAE